jgi:hypothetical protein
MHFVIFLKRFLIWDPVRRQAEACVSVFKTTIDVENKCERRCKIQFWCQREPLVSLAF